MGETSWQVKQRYNQKTYARLTADLPKDFVAEVKTWAATHGVSIAGMIRSALTDWMQKSRD